MTPCPRPPPLRPLPRYAGRWPAPSAAPRSTSPRRRRCWPRRGRPRPAAARWRPGSATPACATAGRPGVVTYSPKVFIPVTRLCRDRCHYCTFVTVARAGWQREGRAPYLSPDEILDDRPARAPALGCLEALFTLGDRPEDRWPEAREWLDEHGLRLHAGLRPRDGGPGAGGDRAAAPPQPRRHVVGGAEPAQAGRPVDGDDARDHLDAGCSRPRARPHYGSPDKDPAVRLRVLEDAGRLIDPVHHRAAGRHRRDARPSAPRRSSRCARSPGQYGAVQEVIVQNFRAKPDTAMRHADDLGPRRVPRRDRRDPDRARAHGCGSRRRPTWSSPTSAGAARRRHRRLGRRLPADPRPREPRAALAVARPAPRGHRGGRLRRCAPRLTVHPEYVRAGEPWLDPRVSAHVAALADRRRPGRDPASGPTGCPGRSPTAASPRRAAPAAPTCTPPSTPTGRTADRRTDFDAVYGDWDAVREIVRGDMRATGPADRCISPPDYAALRGGGEGPGGPHRRARADPDDRRGRRCCDEVCRLADDLRRDDGRRRRDLRGQPQHQLHQRLLRRLPVLRVRPAPHRRRRVLAVAGAGRRPRRGGLAAGRDRGLHAGRHRPRAARHGVLRPGRRGQAAGAGDARARVLPDGDRQRRRRGPGCPSRTS